MSKPVMHRRALDEYLTVAQVAETLNVSRDTVARRFSGLAGVVDHGHEAQRQKRRYRVLRISARAVERYINEHSGGKTLPGNPRRMSPKTQRRIA